MSEPGAQRTNTSPSQPTPGQRPQPDAAAIERTVKTQLLAVNWSNAKPAHASQPPTLGAEIYDNLARLAKADQARAEKVWSDAVPRWATPPAFIDPAFKAQTQRLAETTAALNSRPELLGPRAAPTPALSTPYDQGKASIRMQRTAGPQHSAQSSAASTAQATAKAVNGNTAAKAAAPRAKSRSM